MLKSGIATARSTLCSSTSTLPLQMLKRAKMALVGYSREPSQAKEFTFIRLENGRFAVLPTDHIIVHETSFTNAKWPDDIKRQTETYSCENADDCFGGRAET
jgi:hypothetical protein